MPRLVKIQRALISVSDKTDLIPLAQALSKFKVEMISTGGTLKALQDAGIPAIAMDAFTGFPEMMDGRVKTLHPKVHGGLLFRRDNKKHLSEAKQYGIQPIDLVVVNLYPFEKVTANENVAFETAIENIDIGGPSMLRSAAKNHESVTVICDPSDYGSFVEELNKHKGATSLMLRKKMAARVFEKTAIYDRAIANYFSRVTIETSMDAPTVSEGLPEALNVIFKKSQDLRYGENPHQRAALYQTSGSMRKFPFEQLHGKELSYNNLIDIDAVIDILREFEEPCGCVVKHTNPCGVAEAKELPKALEKAIASDSMSAFGGILGVNRVCDQKTAEKALECLKFFEVFVAPSFDDGALKLLTERKNLRLIATGKFVDGGPYDMRFLKTGLLLQDRDQPVQATIKELKKSLKFVTKTKLKNSEIDDLFFAWKCVKTVKSNAIVLTQGKQTVGIGAGQMSRVDSVFMACQKAGYRSEGALLASDAFFPMPDAIEEAHAHKIRAIIQPGGSLRDPDIIAACDRFHIAMVFTGQRHFRH